MTPETLLKRNKLSITDSRMKILELFVNGTGALTHGAIEKSIGAGMDRVTIYRTLQSFVDKGLIHTIPTSDNSVSYALCKEDTCSAGHHHDNHVHFICTLCKSTTCLDHITIPQVQLPAGFTSQQFDMVISGVCNRCN